MIAVICDECVILPQMITNKILIFNFLKDNKFILCFCLFGLMVHCDKLRYHLCLRIQDSGNNLHSLCSRRTIRKKGTARSLNLH